MANERRRVGLGVAVVFLLAAAEATATTRRVPSEYPTIQAGVDAASAGDSVLVAPGTYTDYEARISGGLSRSACLFLRDKVVVASEAGPMATTIDMQHANVFQANVIFGDQLSSPLTVVDGFTITGVIAGRSAALINESGKVTFRDCVFRDLDGGQGSAAGINARLSDIDLIGCEFRNCVGGQAGGIYQLEAKLHVSGCSFVDCGRGIMANGMDPVPNDYELIVENSQFIRNDTYGAIFSTYYSGNVHLVGDYFEECVTANGGGAASLGGQGPITVEDCVFWRNRTTGSAAEGGALAVFVGGRVTGNTFVENASANRQTGGSLSLLQGSFELSNNVFASTVEGAAVEAAEATVTGGCNVFWQNVDGNTLYYSMFPTDREVDPQFCDQAAGDFHVTESSPCLPEHSQGCGLIGPLGEGCGVVSIEPESWGKLKGAYR